MSDTSFCVDPILRGVACSITIEYPGNASLMTGRVLAHFKKSASDTAPAMVIDTDVNPSSVSRSALEDDGTALTFNFTSAQASAIPAGTTKLLFDVLHYTVSGPMLLPDEWSWPVRTPLTVPTP